MYSVATQKNLNTSPNFRHLQVRMKGSMPTTGIYIHMLHMPQMKGRYHSYVYAM